MKSRYHEDELVDYVGESRREEPKETFKFISRLIAEDHADDVPRALIDIGCACGDFLELIDRQHSNISLTGMDYQEEYVREVVKRVPSAQAVQYDIKQPVPPEYRSRFDIVTMIGFHAKFDEPADWLANSFEMLKPDGVIYALGPFNPYPFDVFINYRHSEELPETRHVGFNLQSKESVEKFVSNRGGTCKWKEFLLPIDLPVQQDNPVRTWTIREEGGRRIIINGLGVIQPMFAAIIRQEN